MYQGGKGIFATFTYAKKYMPEGGNLNPKDMTDFWKRLRKRCRGKIRYYYCGEYGEETGRPHYHAAIWGVKENEKKYIRESWTRKVEGSDEGPSHYEPIGYVELSGIGPESAAYIAGYIIKANGFVYQKDVKEFQRMSNRPGIGARAIDDIGLDILNSGKLKYLPGGDAPGTLQFGKVQVPIGRYLKNRLRDTLGVDQATREAQMQARAINMMELYGKNSMVENYKKAVQGRLDGQLSRKKIRRGRGRIHEKK